MRRTTILTAAALLGLALTDPTTAEAAGETCRGEAATVVGQPGQPLTGTEGRDIIVTEGAPRLDALGGDDLICVTGGGGSGLGSTLDLDAGSGDDIVDGTGASRWHVSGELGTGADVFAGGPGPDSVHAGFRDPARGYRHSDIETDVLAGGGGADLLTTGQDDQPNSDVVDLGSGDDYLTYLGPTTTGSAITGDTGSDTLVLDTPASAVAIDNAAGRLSEDGLAALTWTGMEAFSVSSSRDARMDVEFTGTSADESLGAYVDSGVVRASMGGGDDTVYSRAVLLDGSEVDGGAERDLVYLQDRDRELSLDLGQALLVSRDRATLSRARVTGFEDAEVHARTVLLRGTDRGNELGVSACRGTVIGRSGADDLGRSYDSWFETRPECPRKQSERYILQGGPGNDRLEGHSGNDWLRGGSGSDSMEGSNGSDILAGGPGRDRADGGMGRDRCQAERLKRCER